MGNSKKFMSVKELPIAERPYEKCEELGAQALSDSELLAVIIKSGRKGERSTDLARRILMSFDKDGRLKGLNNCTLRELMAIEGVGKVKAIQLVCAAELGRRMLADVSKEALALFNAESVAAYYRPKLSHLQKETVMLLHADGKGRIISEECLSIGTVNSAIVSPREIFLSALEKHAVGILLVHNHPSGDPEPSREDFLITDRIKKSGRLLGIELLDHVIIGSQNYVSFLESGYI